jgi:hypothetical protein
LVQLSEWSDISICGLLFKLASAIKIESSMHKTYLMIILKTVSCFRLYIGNTMLFLELDNFHSLPHSLTPSLPPSLTHSLTHSLTLWCSEFNHKLNGYNSSKIFRSVTFPPVMGVNGHTYIPMFHFLWGSNNTTSYWLYFSES